MQKNKSVSSDHVSIAMKVVARHLPLVQYALKPPQISNHLKSQTGPGLKRASKLIPHVFVALSCRLLGPPLQCMHACPQLGKGHIHHLIQQANHQNVLEDLHVWPDRVPDVLHGTRCVVCMHTARGPRTQSHIRKERKRQHLPSPATSA